MGIPNNLLPTSDPVYCAVKGYFCCRFQNGLAVTDLKFGYVIQV